MLKRSGAPRKDSRNRRRLQAARAVRGDPFICDAQQQAREHELLDGVSDVVHRDIPMGGGVSHPAEGAGKEMR